MHPKEALMKTLTTLTAVVALVAGMSIANAAEPSSMSKDKSSMSESTKITGTDKFCAKDKSGELNCTFASLSACQSAGSDAECVANPQAGSTTGSGDNAK
jgi:hypothetical protein